MSAPHSRRIIAVGFKEVSLLMRGLPVDTAREVLLVPGRDIMDMSKRLDGAEGFQGHYDPPPPPLPKLCDVQSTQPTNQGNE